MSLSSKRGKRTYPYQDVEICLDAEAAGERDALIALKGRLSPAEKKQIGVLEERMRDSLLKIRVVGVDYPQYLKIQRAHPKRPGMVEPFNAETFYPDFVYKTGYEVLPDGELAKLSEQPRSDWDAITADLTTAEMNALADAIEQKNGRRVETGFLSRGSASTEPLPPISEPHATGE